jgi:hypothetical protein
MLRYFAQMVDLPSSQSALWTPFPPIATKERIVMKTSSSSLERQAVLVPLPHMLLPGRVTELRRGPRSTFAGLGDRHCFLFRLLLGLLPQ